jgi:hypothetical protein
LDACASTSDREYFSVEGNAPLEAKVIDGAERPTEQDNIISDN